MNIQTSKMVDSLRKLYPFSWSHKTIQILYKLGHRDARHDAAEIAIQADKDIEILKLSLEESVNALEHWMNIHPEHASSADMDKLGEFKILLAVKK